MAVDLSFIPSVVSAASGLGGVWLGGYLTSKREAQKEHTRAKAEATYLAILVGAHLDRFIDSCISLAFDDGTFEGQPAGDDGISHAPTESAPTFEPLSLGVEWKSLPPELMYGILNLPYKVEQLVSSLEPIAEYDFPDYTEFFWERQIRFAELGLDVCNLNFQLKTHATLPIPDVAPRTRSRETVLQDRMQTVKRRQSEHKKQMSAAEGT